jgi:hypothetical protein
MVAQIPFVIDHSGHAERTYDIYSRLLEDRIIFLRDGIDDDVANVVIAQMLFLAAKDPTKDIRLYINSPGGSVTSGFAIYDTMRYVKCDLHRPSRKHGRGPAHRRHCREAFGVAQLAHSPAPGVWRCARTGGGREDPDRGAAANA